MEWLIDTELSISIKTHEIRVCVDKKSTCVFILYFVIYFFEQSRNKIWKFILFEMIISDEL